MHCTNSLITIFFTLNLLILSKAQSESESESNFNNHVCTSTTTYASNSTYRRNLHLLLSSASGGGGFNNLTSGDVHVISLCRGDLSAAACSACVGGAAREILLRCTNQTAAILWTAECMVRFSGDPIFASMEKVPEVFVSRKVNVTDPEGFMDLLGRALSGVAARAVAAEERFATGEAWVASEGATLYSLAQCTPDLTADDCNRCLKVDLPDFPARFYGDRGVRAFSPSCVISYELYLFYSIAAATPPSLRSGKKMSRRIALIAVASIVACAVLCGVIGYFLIRYRAKKRNEYIAGHFTNLRSLQFKLRTIEAATNKFSDDNKLGQGGFGPVYKVERLIASDVVRCRTNYLLGTIASCIYSQGTLPDGQEIAVKKLSNNSGQGAKEFKNEVELVAKLQHRNLVKLQGFCLERKEKMLVYEYVCNRSLDHFIHDPTKNKLLDWSTRKKIIVDIARGVMYLHEDSRLTIIHCDLKSSNILLDEEMNAKIADFGIARIFSGSETHERTMNIVGTHGYMAPEYRMLGQFSVKSDVFSFGVILLEIITGKKSNASFETDGAENLLTYVWKHWSDGAPMKLMDPSLEENCSEREVMRCIHVGLLCVQENAGERPVMSTVLLMLSRYFELPSPQRPAFLIWSRTDNWKQQTESTTTHSTQEDSEVWSVNKLTITDLYPRD